MKSIYAVIVTKSSGRIWCDGFFTTKDLANAYIKKAYPAPKNKYPVLTAAMLEKPEKMDEGQIYISYSLNENDASYQLVSRDMFDELQEVNDNNNDAIRHKNIVVTVKIEREDVYDSVSES